LTQKCCQCDFNGVLLAEAAQLQQSLQAGGETHSKQQQKLLLAKHLTKCTMLPAPAASSLLLLVHKNIMNTAGHTTCWQPITTTNAGAERLQIAAQLLPVHSYIGNAQCSLWLLLQWMLPHPSLLPQRPHLQHCSPHRHHIHMLEPSAPPYCMRS
jgi:hypothetical protein